jgi:LysM repeat protein
MDWKTDSDMEDMDDESYSPFAKKKSSRLVERTEIPFILMGIGLLVLIVLFIFFIPKTHKTDSKDLKSLESRLNALEQRIGDLESIKGQTVPMGTQENASPANPVEYQQLVNWIKSNAEIISEIIKKIDAIKKEMHGLKTQGATVDAKKKSGLEPQHESKPQPKAQLKPKPEAGPQLQLQPQKPANIVGTIKMTYHKVEKGETLYRISKKYGISVKKIQELNDMKDSVLIHTGQELIIRAEKQ